ncbi:major facilitator family transporter domain protein [Burkholderia pseudomallei TSV5]|nr:major facilitator family transporter domain protein [Burkholderia pseudomallei TSV5]
MTQRAASRAIPAKRAAGSHRARCEPGRDRPAPRALSCRRPSVSGYAPVAFRLPLRAALLAESKQPRGRLDEDRAPHRVVRDPAPGERECAAECLGPLELRVRPVAAPHEPFGAELGCERVERGARTGVRFAGRERPVAIGAGELHPHAPRRGRTQQIAKARVGDAACRLRATEMIDDDVHAMREQRRDQPLQPLRLRVQLDMPAQRGDALERRAPGGAVERGVRHADQVQPDADDARAIERIERRRRAARVDHRDAAQAPRLPRERAQQVAAVATEKARLHEHAVRHAMRVELREVRVERRVVIGRVAASAGERQPRLEHMRVRVDRRDAASRMRRRRRGRERVPFLLAQCSMLLMPRTADLNPARTSAMPRARRCRRTDAPGARAGGVGIRARAIVERAPARLGQHQHGDDDDRIGDRRADADRGAERHAGRHVPDQHRKARRCDAPEVVAKADARAARAARIHFVEQRAHACRDARREKAERKAEREHRRVAERREQVEDHRADAARGEREDRAASTDAVEQLRAREAAAEERDDDDGEIAARAEHRQMPLGFQIGRQPRHQRVIAAVRADAEQRADQRHAPGAAREDADERGARPHRRRRARRRCSVRRIGRLGRIARSGRIQGARRRLGDPAPHIDDQQRRQQPDGEHRAPCELGGQQRERERIKQHGAPPAERPCALHGAHRLAAVLGADRLRHQHGARRPFAAEAEALQRLQGHELRVARRERAGERADREARDRPLQRPHAAEAVGQHAGHPAAERRRDERRAADEARLRARQRPFGDDRGDHEAEHLHVERIERPAAEAGPERAPFARRYGGEPCEHCRLLSGAARHARRTPLHALLARARGPCASSAVARAGR